MQNQRQYPDNSNVIHPTILWMIAVTNLLIGKGVATVSDGGLVAKNGRLIQQSTDVKVPVEPVLDKRRQNF